MVYDYNISDFQDDCYAFNDIAGKSDLTTLKDIEFQYNLIYEETKEIKDKGIDHNNAKEVLDGVVDVMVTAPSSMLSVGSVKEGCSGNCGWTMSFRPKVNPKSLTAILYHPKKNRERPKPFSLHYTVFN